MVGLKATRNPVLSVGRIPDAHARREWATLASKISGVFTIWLAWACCPFFTQHGCFETDHRKKRETKGGLKETEVKAKERKRSKEHERRR